MDFSDFIEELSLFPAEEKYELLIEYGKKLISPQDIQQDKYLVPGCISVVYIRVRKEDNYIVEGYADSLIVKGIVYMFCEALTGKKELEVPKEFFESFGSSLTPNRANASQAIWKYIQHER